MEEASISEIDHVTIGEGEFFTNCRNNVKSKGLCDVLKFCLVKFAINGADKVFKDQNFRRSNYFIIVLNEEAMLHDNLQAHQYSEKYKFGTNTVLESGRDRWNNDSTYFLISLHFQFGCHIITMKAIRLGWGFFWSMFVCFMLQGVLASGFLFGGFLMGYLLEKPIQVTETLNFDYTKTSPVAFVPIMNHPGMGNPSSLIVKDNVKAGKDASPRAIPYNHKLQLTVSLTVPESDYNRNLGVFQVRVEFPSANGKVTGSSSYPCMMKFKSQPIQFVETIIKRAPLIAGFQSESQILSIKMSEFTEGLEPTACLKVILEQRAEYLAGAGIPEIYAASLSLESELPQFKKIIWNWRRTIFVWISFMCFATELLIILAACRSMIIRKGMLKIAYAKKSSALNIIPWYKTR
ncbi:seipin-2-like [Citrus sinensis]|uniref:seipin-2-like n=1 Tax=Citrus sinensis TaxID=2711 RepID=UPI002279DCEB|nr:seipin-2-like [Citrus sinensis]